MTNLKDAAYKAMKDIRAHALATGYKLRPYQLDPANAIIDSVVKGAGLTFVLVISRQSGKDEMLVHLKTFLLSIKRNVDLEIVEFNPTYKPQTIRAIDRLEKRLNANPFTWGWTKRSDFMRDLGNARVSFLSGDGRANIVGATASLLLVVNEAQDIKPGVYDRKASPMAASTNATRVIVGTVWTSNTLLSREIRSAQQAQEKDGIRRLFIYDADYVRQFNPAYGKFVDGEVARLGRQHPFIKTQYFCEEIDAETGMFNAARLALMKADRPGYQNPQPATPYAFLIDVAGQDESRIDMDDSETLLNPDRDATTLSIVSIDLSTLETLKLPTYRVEQRIQWVGDNHLKIFGQIKAMAERWKPQNLVIDASGVGEGLWTMLERQFPGKVIPVKFSSTSKSEIGYLFIACIETGRFRDCASSPEVEEQYIHTQSEILIGPAKRMKWSVPDGTRNSNGDIIHDDYVLADSLVTQLDLLDWQLHSATSMLEPELF